MGLRSAVGRRGLVDKRIATAGARVRARSRGPCRYRAGGCRSSGTVRRDGSRVWIEAREIELASPPDETAVEVVVPSTPAEPPPAVVFSTPVPEETDVEAGAVVRVQFSRDMDARSFKDRIRVSYQPPPLAATPPPVPPPFAFNYNVGTRGIELKFTKPLERFQTVKVELMDGITAIGGDPLPAVEPDIHDRTLTGSTWHEPGHETRRIGTAGSPSPVSHPRYRSRARLRRPDVARLAHLRHAHRAHQPHRRRPAVVQVARRPVDRGNVEKRVVLHARDSAAGSVRRARCAQQRDVPRQSVRRGREWDPLLRGRAARDAGGLRARNAVRPRQRAAHADAGPGRGARSPSPPGRSTARAAGQPFRARTGARRSESRRGGAGQAGRASSASRSTTSTS